MKNQKIDSILQKRIKNLDEKILVKIILSFDEIKKRDNFITKNKNLDILNKIDCIPSISLKLKKDEILAFEKEILIKRIEEDQQLYPTISEIDTILDLKRIKSSQVTHTGKNVTIGIIDDGIDDTFPSITNNVKHIRNSGDLKKYRGNQITHGTIMASIINNQFITENLISIGIAPDSKLIDFDISNLENEFYFSDILRVLDIIIAQEIKLDVLLISLITKNPSDGKDILSKACDMIVDRGIIIVCPSGNYGPDPNSIGSPAAANKVISIGSITKNFSVAEYSGRGPTVDNRLKPDFCLPGSKIEIPLSEDLKTTVTGSSVSAAIGTGLIALIKEYRPHLSHDDLFNLLQKYSIDLELDKYSQGYGILNTSMIFEEYNLIHEKIIPYGYLIKKSLKITIGFILILIVLFYFFYFFKID
ncbi:MAG: S8 family serine peptidase [Promethearchaeota archaeon]